PTMYCVDVINNKLIYNIAYQFNKTISKERPYPEPETISFYYGSDGKRTLVQGFNMSSGSNYSGPLYIAQEEGQENDGDSDYSSVPNVSDLLIRTNTIEEILVDYDYEGFQYQVRTNEIDQIGFTIYRTDRNEELFDLIESQVELINSGKIYIVHQCTPHLEGATATKEVVATEITFECQNEVYQYESKESTEDSNGNKVIPTYTISEVMHFFFDGSNYKWTIYGSFDPQPIETLGPGDGLSCLQDIIVKVFGAKLWMANKEIHVYTNDQYQSQTDNVLRWKFNTDNFQVQFDDTGIKNSAMCYGKQDDNGNYSFPPFQYRDETSIAVWGEHKADAISNSDINNAADMQSYAAAQLQVDPAISVTLDYQGNEGFATGQIWHLIMELLSYETDIEIIGFTSYPHGQTKSLMEFSNGIKDMIGLYQQMMRRIRAIEGRGSA
ncbi:MAG: minor structural protein, partial [Bacillus sp. (in: firmicutes)]|nr:minor structural protein [Bacillus sp. (in: firmicutes)]